MKAILPLGFSFSPYAQACSFLLMLSPIPLFFDVLRSGKVEKIPNLQFPFSAVMQLGWTIYGMFVANQAIFRSSALALICQTIYSTLACILHGKRMKIFLIYGVLIALTLFYKETSVGFLGVWVSVMQMIASSAGLELLVKSFKERNGGYYNLPSVLMAIPAGLIWGLYGLEVSNFAVIIPSFFDLILYSLQFVCVVLFPSKKEVKKE